MAYQYRVTIPELVTDLNPQAGTDTLRSISTVLWQGDSPPNGEVIDTLLHSQIERRYNQVTNPDVGALSYGHHMFIERRKHVLLGWSAIQMVNIPGS